MIKVNISKTAWILCGALILIILWISIRSCTRNVEEERNFFRIGRDPTWSSLDLMGNTRSMTAFTNDLLSAISKKVHFQYVVYDERSSELFEDLDRGDFDAIMTSVEPNPLLINVYDLSNPFYLTGPVMIVRRDSKIESFEDLDWKLVGVKRGSLLIFQIKEHPSIIFKTYASVREGLDQLVNDQIDAILMDALPAYASISSFYGDRLKIIGKPLTDDGLRLVARKDLKPNSLIIKFNEGLEAILKNGTYKELIDKWGLANTLQES